MAQNLPDFAKTYPELGNLTDGADTWDVKRAYGRKGLREFLAAMFSYAPAWLKLGSAARNGVARATGVKLPSLVLERQVTPEEIPFGAGEAFAFFTVARAKEDAYWVARTQDGHLDVTMAVVAEPGAGPQGQARFSVLTRVNYLSWRGRTYYGLIRPVHHAGIQALAWAGARPPGGSEK